MTATLALPRTDWLARLRTIMVLRPGQRVAHVPGIGVRASRRAVSAGGAANGLLNALIAHWKMDEASGNALDAHANALHVPAVGSPGTAAGKIETARTLSGTGQYFQRSADDALLSTGDVDFTAAAWVNLSTLTWGAGQTVVSKYMTTGNKREYLLYYNRVDHAPNDRFTWSVSSNGTAVAILDATDFGAISASTWYLVVAWHDALNNQIGISVNNVATVAAYSSGVVDTDHPFAIGTLNSGGAYRLNGLIDEVSFWKSAAGGNGVLTADQRTALWNGGSGLPYASFTT